MTESVFYEDSYRKTLSASVTAVNNDWVELDRSHYIAWSGDVLDTDKTVRELKKFILILMTI